MTAGAADRPLRVFLATGEASGDMIAGALVTAMRALGPLEASGIGGERMLAAGVTLKTRTTGWASMGPLEALKRIPPLFVSAWRNAFALRASPQDLVVLIDFGAYNLRLAKVLRGLGYRRPILYFFPPGAWLDRVAQTRAVARATTALTPFAHQRDFYRSLDLPIAYFGHPLASLVEPRVPRATAPSSGGTVALLPGSRRGEIERHVGPLVGACRRLRARRPSARFMISAADDDAERTIRRELKKHFIDGIEIVRGARAALDAADVAAIASGTAVLEATLREVPCVALYVVSAAQAKIARRVWQHPFITLPNILLGREVVPERLQEDATPERLAEALERLLDDPIPQLRELRAVRVALGRPGALERCARFAVELART
jgi:lipid-A-disaccharide synthase